MTVRILAGNVARSTFTPVVSGAETVELADLTVRLRIPSGVDVVGVDADGNLDLTDSIVEDGASFYVDYAVPDGSPSVDWVFRWESRDPSAHITHENRFFSVPSRISNP